MNKIKHSRRFALQYRYAAYADWITLCQMTSLNNVSNALNKYREFLLKGQYEIRILEIKAVEVES